MVSWIVYWADSAQIFSAVQEISKSDVDFEKSNVDFPIMVFFSLDLTFAVTSMLFNRSSSSRKLFRWFFFLREATRFEFPFFLVLDLFSATGSSKIMLNATSSSKNHVEYNQICKFSTHHSSLSREIFRLLLFSLQTKVILSQMVHQSIFVTFCSLTVCYHTQYLKSTLSVL